MPDDYSSHLRITECILNRLSFVLLIQLWAYCEMLNFSRLDQIGYL
jgi:hypothetical protein